jgi:hypothetical protein
VTLWNRDDLIRALLQSATPVGVVAAESA